MGMPRGAYRGAQIRLVGLIVVSLAAVGVASIAPTFGETAFMRMAIVTPLSRRLERAIDRAAPDPAPH